MVMPGSLIPDSNKRRREDIPNRPPPNPGSAGERLARLRARETAASRARDNILNNQPVETEDVNVRDNPRLPSDDDNENDEGLYDQLQIAGDMDGNDDMYIHPPGARSAYFKGPTYQERTLIEEGHWKAMVPALFKAFIVCSFNTRQWGNESTWSQDRNPPCNCPSWKRGTVEVDAVDITSTFAAQSLYVSCVF